MAETVKRGDGFELETDPETGQFVRQISLTDKQVRFASALAEGLTPIQAGRLAGYADPNSTSYKVRNSPVLRAKVFGLRESKIQRMAGLALSRIKKLIEDDKTPAGVALDAAKYTLKLAGHEKEAETMNKDKPLGEMSLADLERLKAAHDALKVVASTQTIDQEPSQVIDIVDESVP